MPRRDHDDETEDLFPELDLHDPRHKAIFSAARKYYKIKAERDSVLTDSKKKLDGAREKLSALMHEAKLSKFRFRGIVTELFIGEERVTVKVDDDVPEGDEDE